MLRFKMKREKNNRTENNKMTKKIYIETTFEFEKSNGNGDSTKPENVKVKKYAI